MGCWCCRRYVICCTMSKLSFQSLSMLWAPMFVLILAWYWAGSWCGYSKSTDLTFLFTDSTEVWPWITTRSLMKLRTRRASTSASCPPIASVRRTAISPVSMNHHNYCCQGRFDISRPAEEGRRTDDRTTWDPLRRESWKALKGLCPVLGLVSSVHCLYNWGHPSSQVTSQERFKYRQGGSNDKISG